MNDFFDVVAATEQFEDKFRVWIVIDKCIKPNGDRFIDVQEIYANKDRIDRAIAVSEETFNDFYYRDTEAGVTFIFDEQEKMRLILKYSGK